MEGGETENYRIYDDSDVAGESEADYLETQKKMSSRILKAAALLALLVPVALFVSNPGYSPLDILVSLFTHETDSAIGRYVWSVDLPVIVAAIVAGAGLSLAGAVMQCVLRNPLASPYTLGLSNAAAFGAAFSVIAFGGAAALSAYVSTPLCAFLFALAATGIIILLTRATRVSSETIILAGIAVSAIFSAGLTLMQYLADPVQLGRIVSWMFGNVSGTSWGWDFVLIAVFCAAAAFFYAVRWDLNTVGAGDEVAKGLGVDTDRITVVCMAASAFLSAVVVSEFGIIAFVGLLGPHTARLLTGGDHRHLIPMSAVTGAMLLLVANTVGQNIMLPMVLPVGLLTSLIGGPLFIYLMVRRFRK